MRSYTRIELLCALHSHYSTAVSGKLWIHLAEDPIFSPTTIYSHRPSWVLVFSSSPPHGAEASGDPRKRHFCFWRTAWEYVARGGGEDSARSTDPCSGTGGGGGWGFGCVREQCTYLYNNAVGKKAGWPHQSERVFCYRLSRGSGQWWFALFYISYSSRRLRVVHRASARRSLNARIENVAHACC